MQKTRVSGKGPHGFIHVGSNPHSLAQAMLAARACEEDRPPLIKAAEQREQLRKERRAAELAAQARKAAQRVMAAHQPTSVTPAQQRQADMQQAIAGHMAEERLLQGPRDEIAWRVLAKLNDLRVKRNNASAQAPRGKRKSS